MFGSSVGGGVAARTQVYRHALVRLIISLLGPLPSGRSGVGWTPMALALGAVLMSLASGPSLRQRFESAVAVLDGALPRRRRVGRTFQGFIKALSRHSGALLGVIVPHLRQRTRMAADDAWSWGGLVPIGVDGSMIDAPRTVANERLGLAGKDKGGPRMTLLLLVHLGAMLTWGYRIGGARCAERTLLRSTLDELPENALLVMDAGFTGFDLLRELLDRRVHLLLRIGHNVRLLARLGLYPRAAGDRDASASGGGGDSGGGGIVWLWPESHRDQPPLRLRLIRIGSVWLITSVTDPRRMSRRMAGELYRRRWGLEIAFRTLKQTLERRAVRSRTPSHARTELAWSLVGWWTLALAGACAIRRDGHAALRVSASGALAAARHAMRTPMSDAALTRRLRTCVIEARPRRRTAKAARPWARKKTHEPPGDPIITTATRAQVAAARKLKTPRTRE